MFGVSVELMNLELGCMVGRLEVGSSALGCSIITASKSEYKGEPCGLFGGLYLEWLSRLGV